MPIKGWRKPAGYIGPSRRRRRGAALTREQLRGLAARVTQSGRLSCIAVTKAAARAEYAARTYAWLVEFSARRIERSELSTRNSALDREGVRRLPEEQAVRLARLPERVAAIVGKTYAERGDSFELADDTAVGMIRDLLLEMDAQIIERNKKKRLARSI